MQNHVECKLHVHPDDCTVTFFCYRPEPNKTTKDIDGCQNVYIYIYIYIYIYMYIYILFAIDFDIFFFLM